MRLPILLVALISTTLAQQQNVQRTARTSSAQIKYSDPNGLKVDWKQFAPQNQWRSHLENSRRYQRGQSELVHPQRPGQIQHQSQLLQVQQEYDRSQYKQYTQPQSAGEQDPNQIQYREYQQAQSPEVQQEPNQIQYKTYQQAQPQLESQIQYKAYPQTQSQLEAQSEPNQIQYKQFPEALVQAKQAILENFKPQRSYPDQSPVLYAGPQQHEQQSSNTEIANYEQLSNSYEQAEQHKSRREYSDRGLQGRIVYKDDYNQPEQPQAAQQEYVSVPYERIPDPPNPKLFLNKNMPREIQELLKFQAQLPYNVIANSITHQPKAVFVPQPLPENARSSRYTSKVYYLNNGRYEPEFESTKPVQEYQRH
ncbi:regulator of nonsense transcripts 1-like [Colletes gigas]|uniref:regulator of nonsense transcripts 1-like n=1 Tax=Colletes gigas TaxID=935657 RepID=UPI001C9AC4E4|nr:regulator of nonsense transcripts 1-like [Colletes gigas]